MNTLNSSFRRNYPELRFSELVSFLNAYGHKMTAIGTAWPLSLPDRGGTLFSMLDEQGINDFVSLTPGFKLDLEKAVGNYFMIRGVPDNLAWRYA